MTNKKKNKYEWEVRVEYVPFTSERQRERSYEFYAESIINGYRNKLKFLEEKANKNSGGLENIAG